MRLVCKWFGYNKHLNEMLFHSINFICDTQYFNRIANANVSFIAPFVRHFNLVPSPYAFFTPAGFRRLVFAAAKNELGCYREEPGRPDSGVVNIETDSAYLHSKQEIDCAYKTYMTAVRANFELTSPLQTT
jgi:hypothetical protein